MPFYPPKTVQILELHTPNTTYIAYRKSIFFFLCCEYANVQFTNAMFYLNRKTDAMLKNVDDEDRIARFSRFTFEGVVIDLEFKEV